jgi:DNA-binding protein H-NS
MTKSYAQLQKQIQTLQKQAEEIRKQEIAGVVTRIKDAIDAYRLTAADLGFGAAGPKGKAAAPAQPARKGKKAKKAKPAAVAKFRDEAGNTWVGRGPRPKWLRDAIAAGKSPQDFAV